MFYIYKHQLLNIKINIIVKKSILRPSQNDTFVKACQNALHPKISNKREFTDVLPWEALRP